MGSDLYIVTKTSLKDRVAKLSVRSIHPDAVPESEKSFALMLLREAATDGDALATEVSSANTTDPAWLASHQDAYIESTTLAGTRLAITVTDPKWIEHLQMRPTRWESRAFAAYRTAPVSTEPAPAKPKRAPKKAPAKKSADTMDGDLRERLQRGIDENLASPDVNVVSWWIGEPATEDQLAAAEAELGLVDPSFRALYAQCNGLQFVADSAGAPQTLAPAQQEALDISADKRGSYAAISIVPLDVLVASRGVGEKGYAGEGQMLVGKNKVSPADWKANIYLFDTWCAALPTALFVDRDAGKMMVIVGKRMSDGNVMWHDADAEPLARYLEGLAAGLGHGRKHGKQKLPRPA